MWRGRNRGPLIDINGGVDRYPFQVEYAAFSFVEKFYKCEQFRQQDFYLRTRHS